MSSEHLWTDIGLVDAFMLSIWVKVVVVASEVASSSPSLTGLVSCRGQVSPHDEDSSE
jgi:hypothetical protein